VLTTSLADTLDPDSVTPGVAGFLAAFLLAIATILLLRDMIKRLRRVRYRDSQAAAEQAALRDHGPPIDDSRDDRPREEGPRKDGRRDDVPRDDVGPNGKEPPPQAPPARRG
jgi:hypothetical protein